MRDRNLVTEDLFRLLVDLEIEKATRLQYCVSVVCLTPDLQPVEAGPSVRERAAEALTRNFRSTDVVTTLSPSAIGLLLIDAEPQVLAQIVSRATEQMNLPVLATGAGGRVTWSGGASSYPFTAVNGPELLRQANDLMARARQEGGGFRLPG